MHRAEGFLYTKHPVRRPARAEVTDDPINDDGESFGYAYTARRVPRPSWAAVPTARERWRLLFGYAYTARYEQIHDEQMNDDPIHDDPVPDDRIERIERIAAERARAA